MNKSQLEKANALNEKVEMIKSFRKTMDRLKNHPLVSEDNYINIDINGVRERITSFTYSKIMNLIDEEVDRYEDLFKSYLSVNTELKTNNDLYEDAIKYLAQLAVNLQGEYEVPIQLIINNIAYGLVENKKTDDIINNVKNNKEIFIVDKK